MKTCWICGATESPNWGRIETEFMDKLGYVDLCQDHYSKIRDMLNAEVTKVRAQYEAAKVIQGAKHGG